MRLSLLILISTAITLSFERVAGQDQGAFGYFNEALLFSQTTYGGSARIQGIGGAQISLGGDVSNILSNPAGLGFFNKSEISFTPGVNIYNSMTSYQGMESSASETGVNVNNLAFVYNLGRSAAKTGKFKGGAIGFSLSRINNFDQQLTYSIENFDNSIIDFYIEDSEGLFPDQLSPTTGAAYDHFVINPFNDDPWQYDSFILGFPIQDETITTKGSQYQLNLAAGGNLNDQLYFGGGLGLNLLNYDIESTFRETDYFDPEFPDDPVILNEMILREQTLLDGVGFTATFGLIYRLNDMIRIGGSVVTPTWNTIDDESEFDFITDYNNYFYEAEDTVLNLLTTLVGYPNSSYQLNTPLRINTGISFFLGKKGFISADLEFLDYSSSKLSSSDFSTDGDNAVINSIYTSTTNFRVGGEYRLQPVLLRLGFGVQGDPYKTKDIDRSRTSISGGAGWRKNSVYVDLAVTHSWWNSLQIPYVTFDSPTPIIDVTNQNTNIAITAGYRF